MESNLFTKLTVKTYKTRKAKKIGRYTSLIFTFLFGVSSLKAQDFFLPANDISLMRMERKGVQIQQGVHFGYKPVLYASANVDAVEGLGPDTTKYYYTITQKLFSPHLIEIEKPGLKLNIDPLFDFSYGREVQSPEIKKELFINTRGFSFSAQIGEKVYIHTDFRENQGRFPAYLNQFIDSLGVFPGNGRVKPFKETGYDFSMANGYVGIDATPWLAINFGHGKQFVGHGYRSLLLSDNAFNYPYAGYILTFGNGKFQYRYTIQLLQNLQRLPLGDTPESIFKRKYASQNYLSYKPLGNFELGLFEAVVWKYFNDSTGTMPFNAQSLIPVPLVNTAVNGFNNSTAKPILSLNMAWQPFKFWRLYGQGMLDNPTFNHFGYQFGTKIYNIFNRVDFLAEYNHAKPGSYAAAEVLQGYTNHNQPLAHPLGAGFTESIVQLSYYYNRIYLSAKYIQARFNSTGRNPMKPINDATVYPLQRVDFREIRAAYIFNPKTNFQVYARFVDRIEKNNDLEMNNRFWYIGIQTSLQNIYSDF